MNINRLSRYAIPANRRRMSRRLLVLAAVLGLLFVVGTLLVHRNYTEDLKPLSASSRAQYVTIAPGTSAPEIGDLLVDKQLIRSSEAFQWYVNSHNQRDKLQAGTYRFSPDMSTPGIVGMIVGGKVTTDLVTIIPGQTLTEIRKTFISSGFSVTQVDAALQPGQYRGMSALADNPPHATLEGFLYPDSYQKTATTDPSEIVREALNEMQTRLTTDVRNGFAAQGLSVYQGVTLASIVEKEVSKSSDRPQVAQVLLKRLRQGMAFQSDVTVHYAREINDEAYDTYDHKGLPPGPIAAISDETLAAVAHPASTDWLYFVTGDDKQTTYFSRTFDQHQANIKKYCQTGCKQ